MLFNLWQEGDEQKYSFPPNPPFFICAYGWTSKAAEGRSGTNWLYMRCENKKVVGYITATTNVCVHKCLCKLKRVIAAATVCMCR